MTRLILRTTRWAPAIVVASTIFGMSSLPGGSVTSNYSGLAHFLEYALLCSVVLFALGVRPMWADALLLAVMIASAYGVTDELHQSFVPMRTPDVVDWMVDTAGALFGGATTVLLLRRSR